MKIVRSSTLLIPMGGRVNQIWVDIPCEEVLMQLLKCFEISSLREKNNMFCRCDLIRYNTAGRVKDLVPVLERYYLKCKAKVYLCKDELDERRCITILRQMLRLFGYKVVAHERYHQKTKCTHHSIQPESSACPHKYKQMHITTEEEVITFD